LLKSDRLLGVPYLGKQFGQRARDAAPRCIKHQPWPVPRLVLPLLHHVPGRQGQAGNVSRARLDSAAVLGTVGADDLDLDDALTRSRRDPAPSVSRHAERVNRVGDNSLALGEVGFGQSVGDQAAGWPHLASQHP